MTDFFMTTIERKLDGRTFKGQVPAKAHGEHGHVFEPDALLLFDQKVAQLAANQGAHGPESFRFLRKVANISQAEMGRLLLVDCGTIRRWEIGESEIAGGVMETVRALALEAATSRGPETLHTLKRLNAALEDQPDTVVVPYDKAC